MKNNSLITAVRKGLEIAILINGIYTSPVFSLDFVFDDKDFKDDYNGFHIYNFNMNHLIINSIVEKYKSPDVIPEVDFWPYKDRSPLYYGWDPEYVSLYFLDNNITFNLDLSTTLVQYNNYGTPYIIDNETGEGLLLKLDNNGYINSVLNITVLYRITFGYSGSVALTEVEENYILNHTELSLVYDPHYYYSSSGPAAFRRYITCNFRGEYPRERKDKVYIDEYGFIIFASYDVL